MQMMRVAYFGNNGAMMGGVTLTTDRYGNPDKAMQFNGTDSYIEVLNSASLNPDSQLTLSAWVLINDTNKIDQTILSKGWDLIDGYYGLDNSKCSPIRISWVFKVI